MKIKAKIIYMTYHSNKRNAKERNNNNNNKIYYNHQNNGSPILNLNINNNLFLIVIQFIIKIVKNKFINING
jgi:hypothetical protein